MDRFPDGLPFQTRIEDEANGADSGDDNPLSDDAGDDDWSLDDLEAAYQRALDAAETVTEEVEAVTAAEAPLPGEDASVELPAPVAGAERGRTADVAQNSPTAERVSTEKVLEALLFVGGDPLPGRRLAELLGGAHLHDEIDELIERLDATYVDQRRPYRVQLVEGGYQLSLQPEFESIRNRVYGLGPKDVRLSQDALEILALVAYRQPIAKPAVEESGKPNVAALLRQLLRLELIALERGEGGKDDVTYSTTPRFLELFSLDRLEDLPHPEDLMFR